MFFLCKEVICVLPHWISRRFHRSHINLLRPLNFTAGGRPLSWPVELNKTEEQLMTLHTTLFKKGTSNIILSSEIDFLKQRLDHKPARRRAATNEPFYRNFSRPLMHTRWRSGCLATACWFHTKAVKWKHTSHVKGRKRRDFVFDLCIDLEVHITRSRLEKRGTYGVKCRNSSLCLSCNRRSHCCDESLGRPLLVQKLDTLLEFLLISANLLPLNIPVYRWLDVCAPFLVNVFT